MSLPVYTERTVVCAADCAVARLRLRVSVSVWVCRLPLSGSQAVESAVLTSRLPQASVRAWRGATCE